VKVTVSLWLNSTVPKNNLQVQSLVKVLASSNRAYLFAYLSPEAWTSLIC